MKTAPFRIIVSAIRRGGGPICQSDIRPASLGRLFVTMLTGHEAQLHSQARPGGRRGSSAINATVLHERSFGTSFEAGSISRRWSAEVSRATGIPAAVAR